ncbi:MAG: PilZ domain-containing protein [Proteobacteria bacterium]|nr:MAG: PilZ domain-containing protein [Pseudomonadota bacterium]
MENFAVRPSITSPYAYESPIIKEKHRGYTMMQSTQKPERHLTSERAYVEIYGRMGTLIAELKNLSATGAFLEIVQGDYIPNKGDLIRVTVPLASLGRTHSVNAEIIWGKSLSVGICFLNRQETMTKMLSRSV